MGLAAMYSLHAPLQNTHQIFRLYGFQGDAAETVQVNSAPGMDGGRAVSGNSLRLQHPLLRAASTTRGKRQDTK